MKTKKKILVSMLCLLFLFSITGMALAAPQDGYYVNGHRYDLSLDVTDAAYLTYLDDMAAIDFDFTRVLFVSENDFADVQSAADAGSISEVLQPGAHAQVGAAIPATVIPIANDGTFGSSEIVSDTEEDLVLERIEITTPADKLVYKEGDELDITGIVVTGYFSDGSSRVFTVTEEDVSGFDSSAAVASQILTVTLGGKTAEYTVEIQAVAVKTPVGLVEEAIANFAPATGNMTFTGTANVGSLALSINKVDIANATIDSSKIQNSPLDVDIDFIGKGTAVAEAFPFAEIICGSGVGANLVSTGELTEDTDNYIITLIDVACPQSLLDICSKAGNINSGFVLEFNNQLLDCQIKISKSTARVVSIDNINLTGDLNLPETPLGPKTGTNELTASTLNLNY